MTEPTYVSDEVFKKLVSELPILKVKKTATTKARLITEADRDCCFVSPQRISETPVPGHVWTREGLVAFEVGGMLCEGAEKELWPIDADEFSKIKERSTHDDPDGWALYINKNTASAIKMDTSFTVDIWGGKQATGEAGDYLMFTSDSKWPLAPSIFDKTYVVIK
jgi:hypothetical protein